MYPFDEFDVVEVWNGLWNSDRPWNADNGAAVAAWGDLTAGIGGGRWLPAMGSSDTHLAGQIAIPHTVMLAGELSASAVLAGIRAGDRSAGIGEQLETRGEPAVVRVVVSGVPSGTVSFHTDQGTVHREPLPDDRPGTIEWRR